MILTLYLRVVIIICRYVFCDFDLKHNLRVLNFAICTRNGTGSTNSNAL